MLPVFILMHFLVRFQIELEFTVEFSNFYIFDIYDQKTTKFLFRLVVYIRYSIE